MHLVFRLLIVVQSAFVFGFGTWTVVEWSNNAYLRDWVQNATGNGLLVLMAATFTAWFSALTIAALVGFRWNQVLGIVDSAEDTQLEQKQLTRGEPVVVSSPVQEEALVPRGEAPQTPLTESVLERRRRYVSVSELRKRSEAD